VLSDGMTVAIVGVGLGRASALALARLFKGLLYGIAPRTPILVSRPRASIGLLVLTLIAIYIPARSAAPASIRSARLGMNGRRTTVLATFRAGIQSVCERCQCDGQRRAGNTTPTCAFAASLCGLFVVCRNNPCHAIANGARRLRDSQHRVE
jgi:hypothetical protein